MEKMKQKNDKYEDLTTRLLEKQDKLAAKIEEMLNATTTRIPNSPFWEVVDIDEPSTHKQRHLEKWKEMCCNEGRIPSYEELGAINEFQEIPLSSFA